MLEGKIIKNISNCYTVICKEKTYNCIPKGAFRNQKETPLVGDYVKFDEKNNRIIEILPRKNELTRPKVANIDIALIVTSLVEPKLNTLLLDKEISLITLSNIKPVLCFTKLDLGNKEEIDNFKTIKKYYTKIGLPVFQNTELKELLKYLKNSVVVLTGQSGAGKSTLLNKINPELNLKTDEISNALNRGKHTTRHTEIYEVNDVFFCDTPGFSSLDLDNYSLEELKASFVEFADFPCKYRDCMHLKETNCGVKKAKEEGKILNSRYESYQKMILERRK